MPNFATHYCFAWEVEKMLDEKLKGIINRNKQAYSVGSMGPDLMFAFALSKDPSLRRFGNDMQDGKVYEMYNSCEKYLKENYSETVHAYLLGYLTHYSLDKNGHAYVNFYVHEKLPPMYEENWHPHLHRLHEVGLDTYVIEEKLKLKNHKTRASKLIKTDTLTRKNISKLYVDAIAPVFDKKTLTEKRVMSCFTNTALFLTAVHNRRKNDFHINLLFKLEKLVKMDHLLSTAVRPLSLPKDKDFLNLNRDGWKKVFNEEERTTETFDEMFDRSKGDALYYISAFQNLFENNVPLKETDFSVNYEGSRINN